MTRILMASALLLAACKCPPPCPVCPDMSMPRDLASAPDMAQPADLACIKCDAVLNPCPALGLYCDAALGCCTSTPH